MVHFGFFCQVVNYYLTSEIVVADCCGDKVVLEKEGGVVSPPKTTPQASL